MEVGAVGVYLNTKYWKVKLYRHLICPVFSNKDPKWIYLKQCYLRRNIYLTGSLRVHWYNTGTAQRCLKWRWRETPANLKPPVLVENPANAAPNLSVVVAETASVALFCICFLEISLGFIHKELQRFEKQHGNVSSIAERLELVFWCHPSAVWMGDVVWESAKERADVAIPAL